MNQHGPTVADEDVDNRMKTDFKVCSLKQPT